MHSLLSPHHADLPAGAVVSSLVGECQCFSGQNFIAVKCTGEDSPRAWFKLDTISEPRMKKNILQLQDWDE